MSGDNTKYDWFRAQHGITNDPNLGIVAMMCKQPKAFVNIIWLCCLEYASAQKERGSVEGLDLEIIAYTQEIPLEDVKLIYGTLQKRERIIDNRIANWEKYQPKREDDTATERKRNQRERERKEKEEKERHDKSQENIGIEDVSQDVTQCHEMSPLHYTTLQNRKVVDDCLNAQAPDPEILPDREKVKIIYDWIVKRINSPNNPYTESPIWPWIKAGADFELDIKPAVDRYMAKKPYKPPRSLSWLDEYVIASVTQRNKIIVIEQQEKQVTIGTNEQSRATHNPPKLTGFDAVRAGAAEALVRHKAKQLGG